MGEFIFELPSGLNLETLPTLEQLISLLPIAVLVIIVLTNFLGFRFCFSLIFMAVSLLSGFTGMHYLKPLCAHKVSLFWVFAIFTAVGGLLVYLFVCIWNSIFHKIRCRKTIIYFLIYGFQVLSAAMLIVALNKFVYTGIIIDFIAAVIISALGLLFQRLIGIYEREVRNYDSSLQL